MHHGGPPRTAPQRPEPQVSGPSTAGEVPTTVEAVREEAGAARPLEGKPRLSDDRALFLLSGFELRWGGRPVVVPYGSQRLVAFLALQSRPVQRAFVGGSLWPETSEDRAGARLRSAIWRLPAPGGRAVVSSTATHLHLDPDIRVDYQEIVAWADAMVNGQGEGDPASWAILTDASHELLPDWYDDWALVERERFRQLRLHVLEAAGERLVREGRYAQALMAGLAAVAAEPLRESAHRLVVLAHIREGNLYEAYRQYLNCSQLLGSELGLVPSQAMESLMAPIGARTPVQRARRRT